MCHNRLLSGFSQQPSSSYLCHRTKELDGDHTSTQRNLGGGSGCLVPPIPPHGILRCMCWSLLCAAGCVNRYIHTLEQVLSEQGCLNDCRQGKEINNVSVRVCKQESNVFVKLLLFQDKGL